MTKQKSFGVLLIHGYTGSTYELRDLERYLRDECGFQVLLPTLPGHDSSPDELRKTTPEDWLEATRSSYKELETSCDRVGIVGLSVGGSLALRLAAETKPAALVAIGAPARIRAQLLFKLILLAARLRGPDLVKPKDGPFADEKIPGYVQRCYQRIPISSLEQVFQFLETDLTTAKLATVTAPALIIEGKSDPIIVPWSAQYFLDAIASTEKKHVKWHDKYHLIVQGERKHELNGLIGSWLKEKLLQ